MARIPKPWYREDRQAWFVTINGERHNLGPNEKEAKRKFHELMAAPEQKPVATAAEDGFSLAEVFEKFLDWCGKHRSPKTFEWTQYRVQMFINALGESVHMLAASLKPFHLMEWVDRHTNPTDKKFHQVVQHLPPWHHRRRATPLELGCADGIHSREPDPPH